MAQDPAAPQPQGSIFGMLFPIILIGFVFYFLLIRPERKRVADHESLVQTIKKNDRVITSGGIYGVVANVQRDADRVTLKVDEATNAKIDVTFGSIAKILDAEGGEKQS